MTNRTYSKQETFDMSGLALVAQGEPAKSPDGSCWYLTDDGRRCAAGHLMTETDPSLLRKIVGFSTDHADKLIGHDLDLVRALQKAHDDAGSMRWRASWLKKIVAVARLWDLDPSRVLEAARTAGWEVPL